MHLKAGLTLLETGEKRVWVKERERGGRKKNKPESPTIFAAPLKQNKTTGGEDEEIKKRMGKV